MPGSELDKLGKQTYGEKWTSAPDYTCKACYMNKTHRCPHPRRTEQEKAIRNGSGPFAAVFLDTFSYPHAGTEGERYGHVLYNSGRNIEAAATQSRAETADWVISVLSSWSKHRGEVKRLYVHESGEYTVKEANQRVPGQEITVFSPDNAREFISNKIKTYCQESSITLLPNCIYTPSQNEAENIVKIVTEGMETLQYQSGLPERFWPYALKQFVRVHFVTPSKGQRGPWRTPFEAFYQKKVPWEKLTKQIHMYGQLCYYYIPRTLREHTHGHPKSIRAYYLGFSENK